MPEGDVELLPINVQKGKHFAEKFVKEDEGTFWYRDEKAIVSGCAFPAQYVSGSSVAIPLWCPHSSSMSPFQTVSQATMPHYMANV